MLTIMMPSWGGGGCHKVASHAPCPRVGDDGKGGVLVGAPQRQREWQANSLRRMTAVSLPSSRPPPSSLAKGDSAAAAAGRYPPGDPRSFQQGSSEWRRARVGLVTASVAGAALGVYGAFLSEMRSHRHCTRSAARVTGGDECSSVTLHRALKSAPRRPRDLVGDDYSRVTLHRALNSGVRSLALRFSQ